MTRLRQAALPVLAACWLAGWACSGPASPSSPAPAPSGSEGLTGTWQGTASDSSGPGQMTWQVTQSGGSLAGSFTMIDTATKVTGRGSVSGTVTGSALRFTLAVLAGGFDPPDSACTAEVSGDAQVSGNSLTGTYTGSNSCAGALASGQLMLSRP